MSQQAPPPPAPHDHPAALHATHRVVAVDRAYHADHHHHHPHHHHHHHHHQPQQHARARDGDGMHLAGVPHQATQTDSHGEQHHHYDKHALHATDSSHLDTSAQIRAQDDSHLMGEHAAHQPSRTTETHMPAHMQQHATRVDTTYHTAPSHLTEQHIIAPDDNVLRHEAASPTHSVDAALQEEHHASAPPDTHEPPSPHPPAHHLAHHLSAHGGLPGGELAPPRSTADGRVAKRARSGPKSAAILGRGASISLARRAAATAKKKRDLKRAELERTGLKTVEVADFMEKNPAMRANVSQNRSKRVRRVKWRPHEVEALKKGVERYGIGRWAVILREYAKDFDPVRISVDLKDKWRNIFKVPKTPRQPREAAPTPPPVQAVSAVTAAAAAAAAGAPDGCAAADADALQSQPFAPRQPGEKGAFSHERLQLADMHAHLHPTHLGGAKRVQGRSAGIDLATAAQLTGAVKHTPPSRDQTVSNDMAQNDRNGGDNMDTDSEHLEHSYTPDDAVNGPPSDEYRNDDAQSEEHLVVMQNTRLEQRISPEQRGTQAHGRAMQPHVQTSEVHHAGGEQAVSQHEMMRQRGIEPLAQSEAKEGLRGSDIVKREHVEQNHTATHHHMEQHQHHHHHMEHHHIEHDDESDQQLLQQQDMLRENCLETKQISVRIRSEDVMHAGLTHDANGRDIRNDRQGEEVGDGNIDVGQASQALSDDSRRALDEHVLSREEMSRTGMEDDGREQSSMERDDIVQGPLVRDGMMADAVVQDEATGGEMVRDAVMHDMRLPEGEDDMLRQVEQRVEVGVVPRHESHQQQQQYDVPHSGMVSLVDNDFQHMKTGSVLQDHTIELGDGAADMDIGDDGKINAGTDTQILVPARAVTVGEDALAFSALV